MSMLDANTASKRIRLRLALLALSPLLSGCTVNTKRPLLLDVKLGPAWNDYGDFYLDMRITNRGARTLIVTDDEGTIVALDPKFFRFFRDGQLDESIVFFIPEGRLAVQRKVTLQARPDSLDVDS